MVVHNDLVLLAQALQEVTGDPHFIGGLLGALAEDLEFPLALGDFGVDAFVIDAGIDTEIEMLIDNFTGDVADVFVANAGVIRALGGGIAFSRGSRGDVHPCRGSIPARNRTRSRVIQDGRAGIGGMRRAIGMDDFAKNDHAIALGGIEIMRNRLEHAIRVVSLGLAGGAAVKSPIRELVER